MTLDDRLRALEQSGSDPALLRAIRLLIEQRDSYIDDWATSNRALDEAISRHNAAVLAAMDG